jgi:hypothetical protein
MDRVMMGVAKIEVSKVNRQRKEALEYAHGVVPIDREIGQQEKRPKSAALPESDRNNTSLGPFRREPLDQETKAKDEAAAPSDDLPEVEGDAKDHHVTEKKNPMHKRQNVRQKREA